MKKKALNGRMADASRSSSKSAVATWKPHLSLERRAQLERMKFARQRKVELQKALLIQPWQVELNKAYGEMAYSKIKPDPARHNAQLFLMAELYSSAGSLSQSREPVWRCPIKN